MLPANNSYDAIVVGAGLGGLSAGATLARAGKRVLIVERNDGPGGNAHAFKRGPYTFDPAVHVTAHGFNVQFLNLYLESLGLADGLELVLLDEIFGADICGSRFVLPTGVGRLTEYLSGRFPAHSDAIARFIETCAQATLESQAPPPRVALRDLEAAMSALPTLFKYRNATLAEGIAEFITDPELSSVLSAQWPYMGLPPSQASFMACTSAFMAYADPGPVYVRGSFQKLADALAAVVLDRGGEISYGVTVSKISVDGGRVTGVGSADGSQARAPVVVSNADARLTFEKLVGLEHLPQAFVRRLNRMRPSISGFLVYSACKLPLHEMGLSSELLVHDNWDHEATWANVLAGRPGGTWLSIPTLIDPSLAPEGEHLMIFSSLMPYEINEPWADARGRIAEEMVERIEALVPGYRESITFIDNATPETFERYTLAHKGALYGWANFPQQTLPKRLNHQTPVEGLLLAGHWTNPGTGSLRCLLSGLQAASIVEGQHDPVAFLATLR